MANRREFLGALSRALLLPVAGTGAFAFADPVKTAAIPVMTAAPLPFSSDCLQLRSIKQALAALPKDGDIGHVGQKGPWYRMMTEEYAPIKMRVSTRKIVDRLRGTRRDHLDGMGKRPPRWLLRRATD